MRGAYVERSVLLILLLMSLLVMARAHAQPESPAYVDGVMLLPQVLVTDSLTPHMVANAELHLQSDGSLKVHSSSTRQMSRVQSITMQGEVRRGDQVAVHITVLKQWECARFDPVHVVQQARAFYLAVTEGPVPDNARCMPGNAQIIMPVVIDTRLLEPGEYQVYAHGRHIAFTVLEP